MFLHQNKKNFQWFYLDWTFLEKNINTRPTGSLFDENQENYIDRFWGQSVLTENTSEV